MKGGSGGNAGYAGKSGTSEHLVVNALGTTNPYAQILRIVNEASWTSLSLAFVQAII